MSSGIWAEAHMREAHVKARSAGRSQHPALIRGDRV